MSRILDELARADERRRRKETDGPACVKFAGAPDQAGKDFENAELPTTIGSLYRKGSAGGLNRLAGRRAQRCLYGAGLAAALIAGMGLDRYLVGRPASGGTPQVQAKAASAASVTKAASAASVTRAESAAHLPAPAPAVSAPAPAPSQPAPAHSVTAPPLPALTAASAPGRAQLPSFLPLDTEDSGYASRHPGWQRFRTEAVEFRVFKERGAVKAIQVMSRREEPLTAGLLDSFLSQVAGKATYEVISREGKAGYLVEKGRLGQQAELVTYRKMPGDTIRALVVVYR